MVWIEGSSNRRVESEWSKKEASSAKTITARCNKSCMDCLSCEYRHRQASTLLAKLFNGGKVDGNTLWRNVEYLCTLNSSDSVDHRG